MNKKSIFSLVAVAALGWGIIGRTTANVHAATNDNNKITIVGSTALQPLAETVAHSYMSNHSGVNIDVQGGGSGTGLSQVQSGAISIGNSDIFAEQQKGIQAKKLQDHKVAVVGMAPVVNQNLKINNLSMNQLQKIFTGKITNWKQVGGPNQKITVINRAKGSGTRATFEDAVLKGQTAMKSQEQDSNGTVQKLVANTPGAISYLAFSYTKADNIKALKIDNVTPTDRNVENNSWKIWSYEHMYTKGAAQGQTKKFLKYMNSKEVQDKDVKNLGYISIHDMQVTKNANGQVSKK